MKYNFDIKSGYMVVTQVDEAGSYCYQFLSVSGQKTLPQMSIVNSLTGFMVLMPQLGLSVEAGDIYPKGFFTKDAPGSPLEALNIMGPAIHSLEDTFTLMPIMGGGVDNTIPALVKTRIYCPTPGGVFNISSSPSGMLEEMLPDGSLLITAPAVTGVISFTYMVTGIDGSVDADLTITLPPIGNVPDGNTIPAGQNFTLTNPVGGGDWGSSDTSIADIDVDGNVYTYTTGTVYFDYTVTGMFGDAVVRTPDITVT